MSIKAIGIAIKLTIDGDNQAGYFQTWVFAMVAVTCIITQLNYLNMVSFFFFLISQTDGLVFDSLSINILIAHLVY